ncbi:MAG: hypothetical protein FJX72_02115 [Armatimonadetes bacterium]|nr:hypothetical protein [Armatimonadota bacterium]
MKSLAAAAAALVWSCGAAFGDRLVLAPTGRIVAPGDAAAAMLWRVNDRGSRGWLTLGVPKDDLGLELEVEHMAAPGYDRATLGAQYSIISEAFTNNLAPALSVGVRDLPNRGLPGRAWYISLSKTIGLSEAQEKWLGSVRLHGGYGSHSMGGAYIGCSARVADRLDVMAEVLNRRINTGARLHIAGPLSAQVHSHDGIGHVGFGLTVVR